MKFKCDACGNDIETYCKFCGLDPAVNVCESGCDRCIGLPSEDVYDLWVCSRTSPRLVRSWVEARRKIYRHPGSPPSSFEGQ